MIYKWVCLVTVLLIILLDHLTKQHYIPPPDSCAFAKTCNHTGLSICGIEKKKMITRLFLDDCDLFEYNCDYHKDYTKTNRGKCQTNDTVISSTASYISTKIHLNISTIEENNSTAIISEIVNATLMTPGTIPASETNSSLNTSTMNVTCICPTIICPNSNITTKMAPPISNSTVSLNTTVSSISMTPITVSSTETINNLTSTEATINTSTKATISSTITEATINSSITDSTSIKATIDSASTKAKINSTITEATIKSMSTKGVNISNSRNSTKRVSALTTCTTLKTTSSTTEAITTTEATIPKNFKENENAGKDIQTSQDKCVYAKHCNRPQTWETTAKGETRDFYQILRAQFGDRVKLLQDTTHFPRPISKNFIDNNEGFQFGFHNERVNEV
ncbi:uncharacterized threonine-rich GPI-anchored glycoprotein PJ4664.02-like [Maniola jurtina]|uniref:uncharacterized threonine-rich GPI-anchored glycoprotein PJ4664.02-like n=1 Tax=Maniola jurtina TaxID=191418 RepID=UPI001E68CDED|nr:uncharacterized threonine-rich GPI-anchored glycoprotein PJ4664.02-like [Maniola jurtina]